MTRRPGLLVERGISSPEVVGFPRGFTVASSHRVRQGSASDPLGRVGFSLQRSGRRDVRVADGSLMISTVQASDATSLTVPAECFITLSTFVVSNHQPSYTIEPILVDGCKEKPISDSSTSIHGGTQEISRNHQGFPGFPGVNNPLQLSSQLELPVFPADFTAVFLQH